MVKSRRLRRASATGVGAGLRGSAAVAACGRLVPDPSSLSSPEGSRPVRWYQAASLLLNCGNARLDTTGPTSLATPADSDEGSGTPLWCEQGPLRDAHAAAGHAHAHRVATGQAQGAPILPTGGVVPDPPSLSAVLAQPARLAGVQPDETPPQQRVIRLDTGQTGWFRSRRRQRRGIRDRRNHKQQPPPNHATPPRPPLQRPAGGPALDLRRPSNAAASRPPNVCAVTRTGARS